MVKSTNVDEKELTAFLAEGTNFKGDLSFEGTVRIDGRFEGNITSKDSLIIGENAVVDGEIVVGKIIISGKVSGNITSTGLVEINSTAQVHGNIKTGSNKLIIHEGAIFSGGCEMNSSDLSESSSRNFQHAVRQMIDEET
ncbi:MAG TPA: polymer-forming cytoskeletal protein [Candidatus Limnocylindrales bacterium]|nr:polymer-forming cytoskeletal protein [Candidatus Limnocylindrales bacterium]